MSAFFLRLGDFNVPGYGLSVTGDLEIRTEDLSGETSATDSAEKGVKPKALTVSLSIRFADEQDLRDLIRVAEAKNSDGSMKIYTVTNRTANAAGVRQVRFTDHVRWQEQDGLQAWSVSFTLREYLSVPERVEQREAQASTEAQASEGKVVAGSTAEQVQEPQTNFERLLSVADKVLG